MGNADIGRYCCMYVGKGSQPGDNGRLAGNHGRLYMGYRTNTFRMAVTLCNTFYATKVRS